MIGVWKRVLSNLLGNYWTVQRFENTADVGCSGCLAFRNPTVRELPEATEESVQGPLGYQNF